MRKVEVVPHNPEWREMFVAEAAHVTSALGENCVAIHHIGSTAIPNIYAKPIIDCLVEVKDLSQVDQSAPAMAQLGYQDMGEFGISGRRYFRKDNSEGVRTHHVHIFAVNSPHIQRHLAFRDYMISHPEDAQKYSELKRELARQHPDDIEKYMDGKDGFIQDMDSKAAQWLASSNQ